MTGRTQSSTISSTSEPGTVLVGQIGGPVSTPAMGGQLLPEKEVFRDDRSASTRLDRLSQGGEQVKQQPNSAFHAAEIALYHALGALPAPETAHKFF